MSTSVLPGVGLTKDKADKYIRRMGFSDSDELMDEMMDVYTNSSTPDRRISII